MKKILDKLYVLYDKFCDRLEKINLTPVRRAAAPCVFVFLALAAVLYAAGFYDFTFIKRPEKPSVSVSDGTPEVQEPQGDDDRVDDGNDSPASPPSQNQTPSGGGTDERITVDIGLLSDLSAEGYYVTNTDFDVDTHKIAVLNVELGANEEFSVRERQVYVPEYTYEYQYGEAKVDYVLSTEARPSLEAYMGYLFADNGTNVIIFDSYGRYVANYDTSMFFAYTRERDGTPLFFKPTTVTAANEDESEEAEVDSKIYYRLSGGTFSESDYIDAVDGRGLHMDYPATYGVQTEDISRKCILNWVNFTDLDGNLTGWWRTVWGFFKPGEDEPFTEGWYDPEEEKDEDEEEEETPWEDLTEEEREAILEERKRILNRAYNYSEGYAAVANEAGQMRFLDSDGEELFESMDVDGYNTIGRPVVENLLLPLTDGIESLGFYYFDHGLVRVRRQIYDYYQLEDWDVKMIEYDDDELIYPSGEKFSIAEGYDIISYSNGMILLEKDGKYGFMDYTGAWLEEPFLDGAKPFLEGLAAVCRDGRWGVIDTAGNEVIPCDYDSIQTVSSGVIVCHSDRGWTVFCKMTNQ